MRGQAKPGHNYDNNGNRSAVPEAMVRKLLRTAETPPARRAQALRLPPFPRRVRIAARTVAALGTTSLAGARHLENC